MDREELKDRLKEAMDIRGLRSVDLVDKTGIPKVTISYYLSGKTIPRSKKLYLLAQALDVSEAWLLGYDVAMTRTDESKKNDQLAKLVTKMRGDVDFYDAVLTLASLSEENESQYRGVIQLLATFKQ